MGIAIAVIVYGLLRYWGLPGWGATLAALPVLFDTARAGAGVLHPAGHAVLPGVPYRRGAADHQANTQDVAVRAAGLLLAYVCMLRGNGVILVVVVAAFLLIRRVGWQALGRGGDRLAIPAA